MKKMLLAGLAGSIMLLAGCGEKAEEAAPAETAAATDAAAADASAAPAADASAAPAADASAAPSAASTDAGTSGGGVEP